METYTFTNQKELMKWIRSADISLTRIVDYGINKDTSVWVKIKKE